MMELVESPPRLRAVQLELRFKSVNLYLLTSDGDRLRQRLSYKFIICQIEVTLSLINCLIATKRVKL